MTKYDELPHVDINACMVKSEDQAEYKYDQGKLRLDLLPPSLLEAVGTIMTYGVSKYGEGNWRQVEPKRYMAAFMRHLLEYLKDKNSVDEESGYLHLWHMACNLAFLIELEGQE